MEFTNDEKKLLQHLVKRELKKFEKEEKRDQIFEELPPFLAVEKKYEMLLKKVFEKIK